MGQTAGFTAGSWIVRWSHLSEKTAVLLYFALNQINFLLSCVKLQEQVDLFSSLYFTINITDHLGSRQ